MLANSAGAQGRSVSTVPVRNLRVFCPKVAPTHALHLPGIARLRDPSVLRATHPEGRAIVEPESQKGLEN